MNETPCVGWVWIFPSSKERCDIFGYPLKNPMSTKESCSPNLNTSSVTEPSLATSNNLHAGSFVLKGGVSIPEWIFPNRFLQRKK
jgi:hypothetical protein